MGGGDKRSHVGTTELFLGEFERTDENINKNGGLLFFFFFFFFSFHKKEWDARVILEKRIWVRIGIGQLNAEICFGEVGTCSLGNLF